MRKYNMPVVAAGDDAEASAADESGPAPSAAEEPATPTPELEPSDKERVTSSRKRRRRRSSIKAESDIALLQSAKRDKPNPLTESGEASAQTTSANRERATFVLTHAPLPLIRRDPHFHVHVHVHVHAAKPRIV